MALVTVDPNQKGQVAALIGVLVVVVTVGTMRVLPKANPAKPAAESQPAAQPAATARVTTDTEYDTSRNPFERPSGVSSAGKTTPARPGGLLNVWGGPDSPDTRTPSAGRLAPMPVQPPLVTVHPASQPGASVAGTAGAQPAPVGVKVPGKPEFTLLAVVRGDSAYSAVIKSENTSARVIDVGDKLDGGYVVTRIDADRAVLENGREIIVATRPQS